MIDCARFRPKRAERKQVEASWSRAKVGQAHDPSIFDLHRQSRNRVPWSRNSVF